MSNVRSAVAGVVLLLAGTHASAATCANTTAWSDLGPPGIAAFGNSFSTAGTYVDCYTFSLEKPAVSFGGVIEVDPLFNMLDIDVRSVSLFAGDKLLDDGLASPLFFSFENLAGGLGSPLYTLAVESFVARDPGWTGRPVGYAGIITTADATVPEPGSMALFAAALLGVAAFRRRRSA